MESLRSNQDDQLNQQRSSKTTATTSSGIAKAARPYSRRIKPAPSKVNHVHPSRFRRFVQKRTCCSASASSPSQPPPPCSRRDASITTDTTVDLAGAAAASGDERDGGEEGRRPPNSPFVVIASPSPRSMQDAYMAWCSSNDILLSPGTIADLTAAAGRNYQLFHPPT